MHRMFQHFAETTDRTLQQLAEIVTVQVGATKKAQATESAQFRVGTNSSLKCDALKGHGSDPNSGTIDRSVSKPLPIDDDVVTLHCKLSDHWVCWRRRKLKGTESECKVELFFRDFESVVQPQKKAHRLGTKPRS